MTERHHDDRYAVARHDARRLLRAVGTSAFALMLVAFTLQRASAQTGDVRYVYDEVGRLVAAISPSGEAAIYHYDAVGNLLSIERQAAGVVSIIEFTPNSGPVGTTVTIDGTGFSSTPSQNTVTFNGANAAVSVSTATRIVTTVPVGATTGAIAVTTPNGSASSSTSFVVASTAPTITSFTPQIGVAGTAVTINGTNFDPLAANDRVKFNNSLAALSSASTSVISTAVPAETGSGRITVATPNGTAVSATDFFIPPSPFVSGDVQVADRMAVGGVKPVSITSAGKIALIVFDGVKNQRVSLLMTSVTIGFSYVQIRKPDGTLLTSASVSPSTGFIDTQTLPTTGTYTILIDPSGTYTGSMTLTLYNVPADVTGSISIGGSPVSVTTTTAGQNAILTFSGTQGQQVTVRVTSNAIGYTTVKLLKPDGTTLTSSSSSASSFNLATHTLGVTGTFTITVDPYQERTGSLNISVTSP